MTEDATLVIRTNVSMHNRRKGGDGEYRNHDQQAKSLQASALVHHEGIIPRWRP
jgi:hypothetical protein